MDLWLGFPGDGALSFRRTAGLLGFLRCGWSGTLGLVKYVDLHMHSTASDGTLTPAQVVRAAAEAGLSAIALTDHDTVAGCPEAAATAKDLGLDFLPGIEISCEFPRPGTMHLLGYGVDPASPHLHALTRRLIDGRNNRNKIILDLLKKAGIEVTEEELLAEAAGATVGRPHLARILVRKGHAADHNDAFKRYLGQSGQFYVDKETTTSRQAIAMIHDAGGLAVLAHPVQLRRTNYAQLQTVVKSLVDQGLDGLEVLHADHRESLIDHFQELAAKYRLIPTGGSDFHGASKPHIKLGRAGRRRVPREVYEQLLERIAGRKRS